MFCGDWFDICGQFLGALSRLAWGLHRPRESGDLRFPAALRLRVAPRPCVDGLWLRIQRPGFDFLLRPRWVPSVRDWPVPAVPTRQRGERPLSQ